jgi:hypothetical protein
LRLPKENCQENDWVIPKCLSLTCCRSCSFVKVRAISGPTEMYNKQKTMNGKHTENWKQCCT